MYDNGSTSETTIEVGNAQFGNALEKRSKDSHTGSGHYIHAAGKAVALHTRPSAGAPATKFLLYDH